MKKRWESVNERQGKEVEKDLSLHDQTPFSGSGPRGTMSFVHTSICLFAYISICIPPGQPKASKPWHDSQTMTPRPGRSVQAPQVNGTADQILSLCDWFHFIQLKAVIS